jgi:primosomal protein N'
MIAEVYPLKRLPRKMAFFDYLAPDELKLEKGSLVQIPYRSKVIWGIVKSIKDKPPRGIELKSVLDVHKDFKLREEELSFFEWLAADLAQSTASILLAAVPRPPKRSSVKHQPISWLPLTLPSSEADHLVRIVNQLGDRAKAFIQSPDIRRSAAVIMGYLNKHPDQKSVILAPTTRDVELVRSRLTGMDPIVITGEETNNERFKRWQKFRSQDSGVLLGTRTAALCIDQNVTSIFMLRAGDRNFKSADRNPRYDARQIVWNIHERFAANLFLFDVAPTPQTVSRFPETELLSWGASAPVNVVDIHRERPGNASSSLTHSAVRLMEEVLSNQGRVLCVHNRKGVASALRCLDCSLTLTCTSCSTVQVAQTHTLECPRCRQRVSIPIRCPSCNGVKLKPFGPGNQEVARELAKIFPTVSISIIDREHEGDPDAQILVVTSYWYESLFQPFKKLSVQAVIQIDADTPLYSTSPTAVQSFTQSLWQWRSVAYSCRAPYLIQTSSSQLAQRILDKPFDAAKEELAARQDYNLPPVYRWTRVSHRDEEPRKSQIAIDQLKNSIDDIQRARVSAIGRGLDGSLQIEVGVPQDQIDQLLSIFTALDDRYIIDTNVYNG